MNWINGIFITFISKLELGTVADWVSGIGSLGAVIVALWQIIVQRKKERKDREIANRPFFSCEAKSYLERKKDDVWTISKDDLNKKYEDVFEQRTEDYIKFRNKIFVFEFKNASQAVATSLVLKIEYQNEIKDKVLETDYCMIEKCVMGNERAIMLPHDILNKPDTYVLCPKKLYLYFTTIDDKAYCQTWDQEESCLLHTEQFNIKPVSKGKIPNKGLSVSSDVF